MHGAAVPQAGIPCFSQGLHLNLLLGESSANFLTMMRSILSAGMLAMVLQGGAQSYVHQVVVLNEGFFDYFDTQEQVVPVSIGSYDPVTGAYQTVATLTGPRFGSDVLLHDGNILVAADDRVLRYDADSYELLAEAMVTGVRKLDVWNDQLLLTRGELGGLDHYFEARDRNTLDLLYTIGPDEGMLFSAEDVLVVGDKAYLAVNNAFDWDNVVGRVGVVDLATGTYGAEVDLGQDGLNPEKLMVQDDALFVFNNKDFMGSSISRVNVSTASLAYTTNVATNSGCAASVMAEDKIYFMEYAEERLARFDVFSGQVLDTLLGSPAVYGLVHDPINEFLYATTTDYFSSGDLHVLNMNGQVISTVAVGVAPGNMALDIRSNTGIEEGSSVIYRVFPNPALGQLTLHGTLPTGSVRVSVQDALGRTVMNEQRPLGDYAVLDIADLRAGIYLVRLNDGRAVRFTKL